jgi:hypothetical protein
MKKTMMALAILAASAGANAGMYKACVDTPNQVPCEASAWDIGGEALYYRNDSNSVIGDVVNNRGGNNNNQIIDFRPDFGWGYRIEGSYHFGTGNDLTVNWAHYDKTSTGTDTFGRIFAVGVDFSLQSKFDIVNVEFGQHLQFGEKVNLRAHAGLQFSNIQEKWREQLVVGGVFSDADRVDLNGWGPRVGMDGSYEIMNGFAFFARGAAAILEMTHTINAGANGRFWSFTAEEKMHNVIPEGELSFGGKYTRAMAQGEVTAKVAWEERVYLNAAFGSDAMSWNGLSFGLKWVGNA